MKNQACQTMSTHLSHSPQVECVQTKNALPSPSISISQANYAVVIPAYNECATIRNVAQQTLQFVNQVIIVDDGSIDDTAAVIEDLPITILKNPYNMGKAASLWRGFQHALAQNVHAVITLDGDGQHSPQDIPRLMAQAEETPNTLIIGARTGPWERASWHRRLANKIADFWVSWAAGYAISDSQSGFRVYPACLLHHTPIKHDKEHGFVFESEILIEGARLGYFSHPVPIESIHRMAMRASHFRPALDIMRITKMVAWKLLSRGMYVTGLYQSLRTRSNPIQVKQEIEGPPVSPNEV